MSKHPSHNEEIIALLNNINALTLHGQVMKQTSNLSILVESMERDNEHENNDIGMSIQSQEANDSIDEYSKVDINEEFKCRMLNLDIFGSLQKDREKLFRRYRTEQERALLVKMEEVEKEYSTKQQSFASYKSTRGRRNRSETQNRKQIFFKGNSRKIENAVFLSEDISKLHPGCDVNDSIIENYLKMLKYFFLHSQVLSKVHIFSTFFFTKLVGTGNQYFEGNSQKDIDQIKQSVSQNYVNVKRWTKHLDITTKEIIIFPINAFKHWFCVMVLNLNTHQTSQNKIQIIYCDSMFQKKEIIIQAIKKYLQLEILDKKGKCISKLIQNINSYQLLLPRQLNTHDCGLYMLTYIQQLLSRPEHLKQLAIPTNRNKLRLFPRKLIFTMRFRLLRLIDKFTASHNEQRNNDILLSFLKQKSEILQTQADFDEINQRQFQKFKKLNLINPHELNYSPQQLQYSQLVRFYLDTEVNHYEKDKPK